MTVRWSVAMGHRYLRTTQHSRSRGTPAGCPGQTRAWIRRMLMPPLVDRVVQTEPGLGMLAAVGSISRGAGEMGRRAATSPTPDDEIPPADKPRRVSRAIVCHGRAETA